MSVWLSIQLCNVLLISRYRCTDTKPDHIKSSIVNSGGAYITQPSALCTHVVATLGQYQANGKKIQEAARHPNVRIVDLEWLVRSLGAQNRIDDTPYLLGPTSLPISLPAVTAGDPASVLIKKRPHAAVEAEPSKKPKKAESGSLHVPVDENCTLASTHRVYIDENDGEIFDATLNQTNAGNNNNKFYQIQLLVNSQGDHRTYTRWGRVGEKGQDKLLGKPKRSDIMADTRHQF